MRRLILTALVIVSITLITHAQTPSTKIYRGSIGDKHIEMRIDVNGSKVTGTYFYDLFRQDIKIEGEYDAKGQLQLSEGEGKKKTGKFVCKAQPEAIELDLECEWARPNGTGNAMVVLYEQSVAFKSGVKVVPKLINDRKASVFVSYPQLTATTMTPGMTGFNALVESLVQKAVKEFTPQTAKDSDFDTNYSVMFADDSIVSIEMQESSYAGGAHPTSRLWTVNYNLKTNKQLNLDDVFKPGDEYKQAVAEFAVKDINRRAEKLDLDEAKRTNTQPQKREDPVMTLEQLPEMDTWGLGSKGVAVYFDFPHVMAVFTKTVVPYSALTRHLRTEGVAPQVK